ncbi:MAG: glycosyltransferase [Acidobacteriaceae bacterium]
MSEYIATKTPRRVCIMVPLCNEEATLPDLRVKLRILHRELSQQYEVEYYFVDDGSTDATARSISSLCPEGAEFDAFTHTQNLGIGASFRTAFSRIKADIVCTIDADCSYAPEDLKQLIDVIDRGDADVAVASPYHPQGSVEGVQRWRLLLSLQCSRLYRILTPLKLHTYTSIFRAYRGSVVREVQFPSDGFVSAVEILLSAASLGYRVTEVPLVLRRRAFGQSKMRILRTIGTHLHLLTGCVLARLQGKYSDFVAGIPFTAAAQKKSTSSDHVLDLDASSPSSNVVSAEFETTHNEALIQEKL